MSYISPDTGVIAEYIDLAGTFHPQAQAIIESVLSGKLLAIIPHPILAETYYVSLRIYEKLKLKHPQQRSEKLVAWLYRSPNFSIAESSFELALHAGRIKTNFGVALTDAYVLSAAKQYKAKAVFRIREREMIKKLTELIRKYEVIFLEDYKV